IGWSRRVHRAKVRSPPHPARPILTHVSRRSPSDASSHRHDRFYRYGCARLSCLPHSCPIIWTVSISLPRLYAPRAIKKAEKRGMETKETVRIGAGAGTSDDRMVPALELAERGNIDYLVFECLAERTVSRENLARSKDRELGYSPSLHARLRMLLPTCIAKGIRIV